MAAQVEFELFSSSFCGACQQTRAVLTQANRLIEGSRVDEHMVESEPALAERRDIDATPTVIIRSAGGTEVLRATGVPTINQVLTAAVRALDYEE